MRGEQIITESKDLAKGSKFFLSANLRHRLKLCSDSRKTFCYDEIECDYA